MVVDDDKLFAGTEVSSRILFLVLFSIFFLKYIYILLVEIHRYLLRISCIVDPNFLCEPYMDAGWYNIGMEVACRDRYSRTSCNAEGA